jgi:filamentous hemagglutinin family protein
MLSTHTRESFAVVAGILLALCSAGSRGQEALIVPDGRSATSISGDNGGRMLVLPAGADASGVSMNSYERFSVGAAGVDFDNNAVRARVLVNEVTGNLPSRLEGEIAVMGPRAHFILANPNGLFVDGARFVNTGGVVLSTGAVELASFNVTPHSSQRNILLHTSRGMIDIGEGGISGAMTHLDLISRSMRLRGPVSNEYSNPSASVRLMAGASTVEIDSSVSPVDERTAWLKMVAGNEVNDAIIVDITPLGSLHAGRIEVLVTDAGAGVRHAGKAHATHGDFTLAMDGSLDLSGGSIQARGHVVIASEALRASGAEAGSVASIDAEFGQVVIDSPAGVMGEALQIQGGAGVTVETGPLRLASIVGSDGDVRAASLNSNGASISILADGQITLEGVDMLAAADVSIETRRDLVLGPGPKESSRVVASQGSLDIKADGGIRNEGGLLQGGAPRPENGDDGDAVRLWAGAGIVNRSLDPNHLAIVFGQAGDVAIQTGGDLVNDTGRIIANGAMAVEAAGDIVNSAGKVAGARDEQRVRSGGTSRFLGLLAYGSSSWRQDFGALAIPGQIAYMIADGDLDLRARNVISTGSSINANDGDLSIVASERIENRALRTGKLTYKRSCMISCRPQARSSVAIVGGTMTATGEISLDAGIEVMNIGGSMSAVEDIGIAAPLTRAESIEGYLALSQARGLASLVGKGYARLLRSDTGGLLAAGGTIQVDGDLDVDGGELRSDGSVLVTGARRDLRAPVRDPMPDGIPSGGVFSSVLD